MSGSMGKYLAELIGTFALVFVGTGAIVVNAQTGLLGNLGIAIAFGSIVAVMIYALGHISGAHINPAVTIALWLGKRFERKHVLPYVSSQLLGACLASLFVLAILGGNAYAGATLPRDGNFMQSFYLEIILTFFLVFVIVGSSCNCEAGYKHFSGIAIGATVALDALFGGPISGASMNPARSFGPALITGYFEFQWIYWLAPILGAVLAVLAYKFIEQKRGVQHDKRENEG